MKTPKKSSRSKREEQVFTWRSRDLKESTHRLAQEEFLHEFGVSWGHITTREPEKDGKKIEDVEEFKAEFLRAHGVPWQTFATNAPLPRQDELEQEAERLIRQVNDLLMRAGSNSSQVWGPHLMALLVGSEQRALGLRNVRPEFPDGSNSHIEATIRWASKYQGLFTSYGTKLSNRQLAIILVLLGFWTEGPRDPSEGFGPERALKRITQTICDMTKPARKRRT